MGGGGEIIPESFHVLFPGQKEYLGNTKTFDNSEQLIKLPGSFPKRKSFQICIHIAKGEHQESLLHRFLASIGMLFFFFSEDIPSIACCLLLHNT